MSKEGSDLDSDKRVGDNKDPESPEVRSGDKDKSTCGLLSSQVG